MGNVKVKGGKVHEGTKDRRKPSQEDSGGKRERRKQGTWRACGVSSQ